MSDRIAVLQAGRIIQTGTPREIYNRPVSQFVAEFIGHSNFLPGTVTAAEPGGVIQLDHKGLRFAAVTRRTLAVGEEVSVAIRYEAISIVPPGSQNGLPAQLELATFAGPTIRLDLRLDNGVAIKAETPTANEPPDLSPGTRMHVAWAPQGALVVAA